MDDDAPDNELEATENAIRLLLDEQNDLEDRILSARHLGASNSELAYDALMGVCKAPEGDEELFRAAARSLVRVAEATGKVDNIISDDVNPVALNFIRNADA